MNCKEGDLAIVVRSKSTENIGKVVRCLKYLPPNNILTLSNGGTGHMGEDGWEVDCLLLHRRFKSGEIAGYASTCADRILRPLRDTDQDDETFSWAGRPVLDKEHI